MGAKRQLESGIVLSYISILLNIATGLVFTPWVIGQIGQSEYGLYTLSNSLITFFLIDFGLSAATTRFVAKYRAEEDEKKVNDFLGIIYKLYLAISAIISILFFVVYFFIDAVFVNLSPREIAQFKVIYIISAVFSVVNFPCITFNGILTAYEKFIALKLADIIYRVFFVVFTGLALWLGYGLYALVSIHAFVGLVSIAIKYFIIKKTTPIKANFRIQGKIAWGEIFAYSSWTMVSGIAQRFSFNFTPSVLGAVVPNASSAIAIFGVVTAIESYAYLIPGAINGFFMPRVSDMYAKGQIERVVPLLNNVGKIQAAINGIVIAGFVVLGREFLDLWVGDGYAEAYWGIILVLIPSFFYNALQIANTTIMVVGKVKYKAIIDSIMAVINVILAFLLAPRYGALGACIAIFVAYMVRVAALIGVYKKVLELPMLTFMKSCYLPIALSIVMTIWICNEMFSLLVYAGWFAIFGKAIVTSIAFLIVVFVFVLTKQERKDVLLYIQGKKGE